MVKFQRLSILLDELKASHNPVKNYNPISYVLNYFKIEFLLKLAKCVKSDFIKISLFLPASKKNEMK